MDFSTGLIILVAIVLVGGGLAVWRIKSVKKVIFGFKAGNVEANLKAEGEKTMPGVRISDAISREGALIVADGTGRGADIEKVDVAKDISVTTTPGVTTLPKA